MADQCIDKRIICQAVISSTESRTLHPGIDECLFIRLQLSRPITPADNNITRHRCGIRRELCVQRSAVVAGAIESVNQSTCFLELNRQKIGCRNIDSPTLDAVGVVTTLEDLITPEVESA